MQRHNYVGIHNSNQSIIKTIKIKEEEPFTIIDNACSVSPSSTNGFLSFQSTNVQKPFNEQKDNDNFLRTASSNPLDFASIKNNAKNGFNSHKIVGTPIHKMFVKKEIKSEPELNIDDTHKSENLFDVLNLEISNLTNVSKPVTKQPIILNGLKKSVDLTSICKNGHADTFHSVEENELAAISPNINTRIDLDNYKPLIYQIKRSDKDSFLLYKCSICYKTFNKLVYFDEHILLHNGTPFKIKFKCELCDIYVSNEIYLRNHVIGHTEFNKPHKCIVCELTFGSSLKLKHHSVVHKSKSVFKCGECAKFFYHVDLYQAHTFLHNGIKPFICSFCNDRFIHSTTLSAHEFQCKLIFMNT